MTPDARVLDAGASDGGPVTRDAGEPDSHVGTDACAACDAGLVCERRDGGCVPGEESFEELDYPPWGQLETPHIFDSGLAITALYRARREALR